MGLFSLTKGKAHATRPARVLVLLIAASLLSIDAASAITSDDAGTGTDAGPSAADAIRLPTFGRYEGNVSSQDVSDWYRYKLPSKINDPICVRAPISTNSAVLATLVAVNEDDTRESSASVLITRATHLGIATPGLRGAFLNVSVDPLSPPVTALGYNFELGYLRANQLPPGDAGTGTDAPSGYTGTIPVPSGCFGGRLNPNDGDPADSYQFTARAGDRIVVSAAGTASDLSMKLFDQAGNLLATLTSGNLTALSLQTSGIYYMTMSSPSASTYVVGLCGPDCGPPQQPCRPMCALLMGDSS